MNRTESWNPMPFSLHRVMGFCRAPSNRRFQIRMEREREREREREMQWEFDASCGVGEWRLGM